MDQRTAGFIMAGVTSLAFIIFWEGLLRAYANANPTSATSHGLMKLIG